MTSPERQEARRRRREALYRGHWYSAILKADKDFRFVWPGASKPEAVRALAEGLRKFLAEMEVRDGAAYRMFVAGVLRERRPLTPVGSRRRNGCR